jgi:hypothetical protein
VITDEQYTAWLQNLDASRVLLVEATHSTGVEYFANAPFISTPDDTAPNRIYDDLLQDAVDIQIRLDGLFTLGEITVTNDGSLNDWIGYKWRGYSLVLLLGDPDWPLDDFRPVVNATNGGIINVEASQSGSFIRFGIYDSRAVFDAPISRTRLPDNRPVPLAFGSPFNVRPALLDDPTHEYQVHDGAITSVTVRDNGAVVSNTPDTGDGTFVLAARPQGNIGADLVTTTNTPAEIIEWVCDEYGVDFDSVAMAALPAYNVGLYYEGEVTGAQILDDVCKSIGAYWRRDALGEVQVVVLDGPEETADIVINEDDVVAKGLKLTGMEEPVKPVTLKYARNFAPAARDSLAGILDSSPAFAERLTKEWSQVTTDNALTGYPLAPVREYDTYLTETADAQDESDRRAALRETRRERWQLECYLTPAQIKVGQTVEITNPRFAFDESRNAVVIAISFSLTTYRVTLEVWL